MGTSTEQSRCKSVSKNPRVAPIVLMMSIADAQNLIPQHIDFQQSNIFKNLNIHPRKACESKQKASSTTKNRGRESEKYLCPWQNLIQFLVSAVDGIRAQLHAHIKIMPKMRPHEGESNCISIKTKVS